MYFGGVASSLRKEVWPFLLGHYQFTMTEKARLEVFHISFRYEKTYVHISVVLFSAFTDFLRLRLMIVCEHCMNRQ